MSKDLSIATIDIVKILNIAFLAFNFLLFLLNRKQGHAFLIAKIKRVTYVYRHIIAMGAFFGILAVAYNIDLLMRIILPVEVYIAFCCVIVGSYFMHDKTYV